LKKKIKSLETDLHVAREQLDRTSNSKLSNMLSVQKSSSNKTGLGYVKGGSSSMVTPTKFVPFVSVPKPVVRV